MPGDFMRDMPNNTEAQPAYALCFSGGKDSTLALDRALRTGLRVKRLLTLYDQATERIRFHGVPVAVMRAQAAALGLPITLAPTTPATFEHVLLDALAALRAEGCIGLIFGNIHLADVRGWYEERVRAAGLEHVEPLWGEAPATLVREVVARGYQAIVTCIEEGKADPGWLGQPLTEQLVADFERAGIDPCGELGEYHTLVCDGPLFRTPLRVQLGEVHSDAGFRQVDVALAGTSATSNAANSMTRA
jgi:diphthine-ammonia ligase